MNLSAIFHDECHDYLSILEPKLGDDLEIRLRVGKDEAKRVYFVEDKKYLMTKYKSDEYFDYYKYELKLEKELLRYAFLIEAEGESVFFSKIGIIKERIRYYDFKIIAGFKTPDWAKGCIMYQIYIDRFNKAGEDFSPRDGEYVYIGRPVESVKDWKALPESFDVHRFYGGNLQGVWDKIDYLKSIGVEVIYFNPLFVSPSNHKYDAQDYDYIDPHLTIMANDMQKSDTSKLSNDKAFSYIERTANSENLELSNAFFAKFMDYVHSKGIKVILDGVFNHCGSFHKWMDREHIYASANEMYNENYPLGAFISKDSKYREYFAFSGEGMGYAGWWGHATLPKLNYENSENLLNEILRVAKKWISPPYNVDGWRLDVAADLGNSEEFNHSFWKKFRQAVKTTDEDALILAEHYGNPAAWLDGKQWDSIMNYDAFMEPVTWFLTGLEKHSDREDMALRGNGKVFFDMLRHNSAQLPMPALLCAMNELSNHDHSRFLTRTNKKVGRIDSLGSEAASEDINYAIFRQAIIMQMSLQGAPTLYYGDEAGVCGFTDPDNRRTYPWGNENYDVLMFYRYLALIHKENICLKLGSFIPMLYDENLIVYARTYEQNKAIILIYTGEEEKKINIPIYLAGITTKDKIKRLIYSDENAYNSGSFEIEVDDKYLEVELKANMGVLYVV